MGTTVGSAKFTDQDYADDAVLFSDCPSKWPYILSGFDEAADTMGLNTSWSKTKIQNLSHGVTPAPVQLQLQGHVVESTGRFTYLGSDIHSSERSTPEILRRIGLASNIFGRLCRTWVQQIEDDTGLNANDAWRIAHDRKSWRALRPVKLRPATAGQAFHWLTDWLTDIYRQWDWMIGVHLTSTKGDIMWTLKFFGPLRGVCPNPTNPP